jgi:hypothetical protein
VFTINVHICTRQKFNSKISQTKYLEFFTIQLKIFKNFGTIKTNLIYVKVAHVQQYIFVGYDKMGLIYVKLKL